MFQAIPSIREIEEMLTPSTLRAMTPSCAKTRPRLVKILERPAGQQFAPFQRPLEGTVKLGWRLTDWADEKGHAELVVSKNTNELKTGSPERFRLEVSRLG